MTINDNERQLMTMEGNNPTNLHSWQLLLIPPLVADCQLVCGAAWDFASSSVQSSQYSSSWVREGPDPNKKPFNEKKIYKHRKLSSYIQFEYHAASDVTIKCRSCPISAGDLDEPQVRPVSSEYPGCDASWTNTGTQKESKNRNVQDPNKLLWHYTGLSCILWDSPSRHSKTWWTTISFEIALCLV